MTGLTETSLTQTSPTQQSAIAQAAELAAQTGDAQATALTDYDDFLTLLVSQVENQDPLEPVDSTQFVEQLATFSSLEAELGANDRLDLLIAESQEAEIYAISSWIGREVQADGAAFQYTGDPLDIETPGAAGAASGEVIIRSGDGVEIARLPALPTGGSVTWNGATADGGTAQAGLYFVEYAYTFGEGDNANTVVSPASGDGAVVEARINAAGETELVLDSGVVITPERVTAVRATPAETPSEGFF